MLKRTKDEGYDEVNQAIGEAMAYLSSPDDVNNQDEEKCDLIYDSYTEELVDEVLSNFGIQSIAKYRIESISHCEKVVTFNDTRLDAILVEITKKENDCYFYKSTLAVNGRTEELNSKFCLE